METFLNLMFCIPMVLSGCFSIRVANDFRKSVNNENRVLSSYNTRLLTSFFYCCGIAHLIISMVIVYNLTHGGKPIDFQKPVIWFWLCVNWCLAWHTFDINRRFIHTVGK